MPLQTQGPLRGFLLPDYHGGSIVNLLASLIRARGGRSPHRSLRGLPAGLLRAARRVVYLVVDGLGEEQLRRHLRAGGGRVFFGCRPRQVITTVFPATTASAVITFTTGASPAEHGLLSWYLHLPDLGMVSTILRSTTRTGQPMAGEEFDLPRYLAVPSHLAGVPGVRAALSYGDIAETRMSRAVGSWTVRRSYRRLEGLRRAVLAFARQRGRGLAYVYWPEYDGLCHAKGCAHRVTTRHLEAVDRTLGRLAAQLRGTGTVLLVTADHGLVDVPPARHLELRDVPGFYDCLAVLPSGDAREVSCFVRPGRVREFLALVRRRLAGACVCVAGAELIRLGAYGPGRPHPALAARVGDYVLLARESCAFSATPPGFTGRAHIGQHGGMSAEEIRIPLYVVSDP